MASNPWLNATRKLVRSQGERLSGVNFVKEKWKIMRLTLRTLLAYLDDVLSPTDTKLIGQKIQESPMAQLLVSRIREVMRRRRLKAPDVVGAEIGIDPNIVSQYLDNTLPPEQYADVERVLLASDELLAETAACHQVLTLILGETNEVSSASRERLYALGPVESSSQLAVTNDTSFGAKSRTPESIAVRNVPAKKQNEPTRSSAGDENRITTVPDYLKPTPWTKRVLPSAIVLVLVVFCAALFAPGILTGVRQANKEIQRKVERNKAGVAAESKVDESDANGQKAIDEIASKLSELTVLPEPSPSTATATNAPSAENLVSTDNEPDDDLPTSAVASKDLDPSPPAPATVPPAPVPAKDLGGTPRPNPISPEILSELQVRYSSTEGVVIQRDEEKNHWFVTPHQTDLKPDQMIANLEPFDATLEFEKAGVRTTLVGESVVQLLLPNEMALQGIRIARGRMVFQPARPDDSVRGVMGIMIGEDLWKLEFPSAETVCALEVTTREPSQFMKLNDYHWYQATLYVLSGAARWTNRAGQSVDIEQGNALNIIPERAATLRAGPIRFQSSPDWVDASKRRNQPLRRFKSLFEKSFVAGDPVEQTMLAMINTTKNAKFAELAARCLSAIDDCAGLVETLASCPHEEARAAARDGLRQWLPMNPEYGPRLTAELEKYYPPTEADAVYRLLWGFSREDVKGTQVTALQLVGWLRSSKLQIRELADFWVERLKGKPRNDFIPSAPQSQREAYVNRLEEQIQRDNGLVKGP